VDIKTLQGCVPAAIVEAGSMTTPTPRAEFLHLRAGAATVSAQAL